MLQLFELPPGADRPAADADLSPRSAPAETHATADRLMVFLSPAGVIQTWNETGRRKTGLGDAAVLGKRFWEALAAPAQAGTIQDAFDRLRQGEASVHLESRLATGAGEVLTVAWTFTIMQRDDGRLQLIVGSGVEVARRAGADERGETAADLAEKNQAVLSVLEQCLREGRLPPRALLEELLQRDEEAALWPQREMLPPGGRRPYPFAQHMAPWRGGRLPSLRAFCEVRCRDISSEGISFFLPLCPDFDRLVIALGAGEAKVHIIAEVRHVSPFEFEGRPTHLVGCRFLARVYY